MTEPMRQRPLLALSSVVLELELLTPLHVGAGGPPLVGGYDVVADPAQGRYYLVDVDRLIAERMTEEQLARGSDPRVEHLITPQEWPQYARAVLPGPRGRDLAVETRRHWEVLPFTRDAHGHPYLPGSSLKGALRTALAYELLRQALRTATGPDRSGGRFGDLPVGRALWDQLRGERRTSREWFARPLETSLFQGSQSFDPNHDLLRALRPNDSAPLPLDASVIEQVGIYRLHGGQLRLVSDKHRWLVEALPPDTRLTVRLDVDAGPFGAERGLPAERRAFLALEALFAACRAFAWRLVTVEYQSTRQSGSPLATVYASLAKRIEQSSRDEAFLQLGWGTGWRAKTIGPLLELSAVTDGPEFLATLVRQLRLDRAGRGLPFPRTRRYVERSGRPAMPLGWVRVRPRWSMTEMTDAATERRPDHHARTP
ncbi:MAG: type III-A CRISPR-associated RAMP protein Csm5 [Thermomicrobium sp.]|nr:type III-A CRISPR-associated RAMP protein Csm5 [Thermomicrobium sp.]